MKRFTLLSFLWLMCSLPLLRCLLHAPYVLHSRCSEATRIAPMGTAGSCSRLWPGLSTCHYSRSYRDSETQTSSPAVLRYDAQAAASLRSSATLCRESIRDSVTLLRKIERTAAQVCRDASCLSFAWRKSLAQRKFAVACTPKQYYARWGGMLSRSVLSDFGLNCECRILLFV